MHTIIVANYVRNQAFVRGCEVTSVMYPKVVEAEEIICVSLTLREEKKEYTIRGTSGDG